MPSIARPAWRRDAAIALSAVTVLAGVAGCGGSAGPAALAVRCAGSPLSAPDSSEIDTGESVLSAPVSAVIGVPRPTGLVRAQLPSELDPGDPRYGYVTDGWRVARVSAQTGRVVWSVSIPAAAVGANPAKSGVEYLRLHAGYVIAVGEDDSLRNGHDYVAAVSASGRLGPVCALPEFQATDGHVELLPHAGVVVMSNPAQEAGDNRAAYLEGYAVSTSKRLWSVSSQSSDSGGGASYLVAGDDAFVWRRNDGRIAAYDTRTGHERWLADPGTDDPYASDNGLLAAVDGRVYAQSDRSSTSSSELVAIAADSGRLVWKHPESEFAELGLVSKVAGVELLVTDYHKNGKAYLLDSRTGKTLASQPVGVNQPALCDPGGVPAVALAGTNRIYVLSPDSRYNRTILVAGRDLAAVAITSTMAYVSPDTKDAPVYGYDLATGKLAWKVNVPDSPAMRGLFAYNGGFALVLPRTRHPSQLFS